MEQADLYEVTPYNRQGTDVMDDRVITDDELEIAVEWSTPFES